MKKWLFSSLLLVTVVGGIGLISSPARASGQGTVPAEITTAVKDAKASVEAISGVSTVALAVGLSPLGAMLSLRFLNMILSRV